MYVYEDEVSTKIQEGMGRLSLEIRAKVIRLKTKGVCVQQIVKHLQYEGVNVLSVSLYGLLKKYETTRSI